MLDKSVLYITYDGLSDPLGQSQILPYIRGLCKNFKFTILSFEKRDDTDPLIKKLEKEFQELGLTWFRVRFTRSTFLLSKIYDILKGIFFVLKFKKFYDIIHARSYPAAFMACTLLLFYNAKFIFDMRGFWPEERVDGRIWSEKSWYYKLAKFCEKICFKRATHVVVLTDRAARLLLKNFPFLEHKISVIPTCVDTKLFYPRKLEIPPFSLCYSGSLATWYRLDRILAFFDHLLKKEPSASLAIFANRASLSELDQGLKQKLFNSPGVTVSTHEHSTLPLRLSLHSFGIYFYDRPLSAAACCPTKLGEFLAMGMPVITNSGIGDCDKWIKKNNLGVIMADYSEQSYENGVKEILILLRDDSIYSRCRKFAIENLSLEIGVERYKAAILMK